MLGYALLTQPTILKAFEDGANEGKRFKNEIDGRIVRRFRGIGRVQQGTSKWNVGTETQSKTRPIGEYYTRRSKSLANELQEVISPIPDDIDEILRRKVIRFSLKKRELVFFRNVYKF